MSDFADELFRLIQNVKDGTNPFSTQEDDEAADLQMVTAFTKKWDLLDEHNELLQKYNTLIQKFAQEKSEWSKTLIKDIMVELLPAIDAGSSILKETENKLNNPSLSFAIKYQNDYLVKILLKRDGCIIAPKKGDAFNPELHQAISIQKTSNVSEINSILELCRCGYKVLGQVIRPAEVKVFIDAASH